LVAQRNHSGGATSSTALWLILVAGAWLPVACGQDRPATQRRVGKPPVGSVSTTATIHWQDVPLRDAIGRLEKLFDEAIFLDRHIDSGVRVSLDIEATSTREVLTAIAAEHGWGVSQLGRVVYVGPPATAGALRAVAQARSDEAAQLAGRQRTALGLKRQLSWARLAEPRELVASLVEKSGWRVARDERIPHDLWAAGELPGLTMVEQLTVLLVGFDMTFELKPNDAVIEIVPLDVSKVAARGEDIPVRTPRQRAAPRSTETKQVYTLRVAEKPVGAVVRELAQRLNWQVEFDEAAIRAAGRSLDQRVSFKVENVDQEELLRALLWPAGLDFRRDGERIRIVPREAPSG
jgi:hypothetical protein